MDFVVTKRNINLLTQLIKNYEKEVRSFSPEEFADNILSSVNKDEIIYNNFLVKAFLNYKRHEKIFECIFDYLSSVTYKFKENYKERMLLLMYLFIFVLNKSNFNNMKKYCVTQNDVIFDLLMGYVCAEHFLILITEITCRIFGSQYTLSTVIQPLVTKMELLKLLYKCVVQHRLRGFAPKPVTIPISPRLTKSMGKSKNPVEGNEPAIRAFISKKVPRTTYVAAVVEDKLLAEFEKNRENALKLLEEAKRNTFACAKLPEKPQKSLEDVRSVRTSKARKLPKLKPVTIKTNTTMVMREAAQMMKKCEEEIKKIKYLTTNAYNTEETEHMKEEKQRKQQTELLQSIRKKHLLGLLTREEAMLAKQNVIKVNKEKMKVFKEERVELYRKLEDWKEKEQEKMQTLIEKSQNIQKNAKEAEKKSAEDKTKFVKQMQQESKELMDKAMKQQREELNRKIELIKDLKELQSLKDLNKKEFDPTETCNLGLLCEMSIAELQERLFVLKVEVQEAVEKKKNFINEKRKNRQEMLDNTKEFVTQNQTLKVKKKKDKILVAEDTPEITELRNRIAEAKITRLTNSVK